jgi:2-dehydro-3-deoxyphosphogalactonate aldolase
MTPEQAMAEMPIVAILRGVRPDEILGHADAVYAAGIRLIEVPLNSPEPLDTIRRLAGEWGERMACGGGTVLKARDVDAVAHAGGRIIVAPNTDPAVIQRAVDLKLAPMPGFATASEAFTAYGAGARYLKLFPAAVYGPAHVKALLAVLPKDSVVMAVGGAGPANMAEWWAAGARGFGLGGEVYKAGQSPEVTLEKAKAAVEAVRALR